MDAKPQKPTRGFRVHGDENAMPMLPGKKTLHSRNKSSPALSTMAALGANKLLPKRAAFGDVSNTTHGSRPTKDDLAVLGKKGEFNAKDFSAVVTKGGVKELATLSRPAQRPLTTTNIVKNTTQNWLAANAGLQNQNMIREVAQPAKAASNTRRVLAKKNTTIFRDYSTQCQNEVIAANNAPVQANCDTRSRQASLPSVPSEIKPKHHQIRKVQSVLSVPAGQIEAIAIAEPISKPVPVQKKAEEVIHLSDPPLRTDDHSDVPEACEPEDALVVSSLAEKQGVLISQAETGSYLPEAHDVAYSILPEPHVVEVGAKDALLAAAETEEYWDDEEDENYDEEGYVTARSFRSRADNLTGNATTTLVPKINNRVQKEVEAAKLLVESMKTPEDIEDELWDTSMVAEYGVEIFNYMRELEDKMQPNPHYMDVQTEIQWSMRSVLMDWLVQVHHRFQLLPETLFLCVNYIDRFLSYKVVSLGKLQLVGATAIFIAAKYEEINCPSVNEIVYMVDNGYTVDEILKAERFMLSMLQFELGWPGPMSFLRRISKADDYDLETRTLAKYFLEVTIMDERFLGCPPSFTAAGAHCLARLMLYKGSWTPHHVYYSGYTYSQLHSLLHLMYECCEDPAKHHAAIYDKYQDKRYKCASRYVANEVRQGFRVPDVQTNNAQTFMSFYDIAPWNPDTAAVQY